MQDSYNIPEEILKYAEEKGIGAIGTGGGCDYIWHKSGKFETIICGINDPLDLDDLNSPCFLVTFEDENWENEYRKYYFNTVKTAIDTWAESIEK